MIFSSIEFLLCFFPVFLLCYSLTPRKLKNATLLLGSLIFYAFGDVRSLPILMASILFNYFIGRGMAEPDRRKGAYGKRQKRRIEKKNRRLLAAAVVVNIGVLCLFKYLPGRAGLPLGISFYTFQVLSYLIDVYRGEQKKELSFVRFAAYISMFPQLVSGPIVLYGEVRSKLWNRRFCAETLQDGLKVFTAGLAAKVLLADRIGILWHDVQVTGFESISTPLAWLGAVAFSLKIYFDFYGYSLMAVGLGRILGFELPQNFREPYMAVTVRDFYRRWHMTLGRWFCKYVYIPLGGSRNGELRTALSLLAVWFLTGIWHGSTANFLIWSMMLWLLIVMERQAERAGILKALDRGALRVIPHHQRRAQGDSPSVSVGGDPRDVDLLCRDGRVSASGISGQNVRAGAGASGQRRRLAEGAGDLLVSVRGWLLCLHADMQEALSPVEGHAGGHRPFGGAVLAVRLEAAGGGEKSFHVFRLLE